MGFDTTVVNDADFSKMQETIKNFVKQISSTDLVVFFFAGHGVQWNHQNYLLPIDAHKITKKNALKKRAINAQITLSFISEKMPYAIVFFLDCCRDYWTENKALRGAGTRSGLLPQIGLANMSVPVGSLVAFACEPGKTTKDVASNNHNGLFTFHLLKHVAKPNTSIEDILCDVCDGIQIDTNGAQIPHRISSFRYRNISFNSVHAQSGKHIHFNHISATLREHP
jgi:uncharacterized caspase-like protein